MKMINQIKSCSYDNSIDYQNYQKKQVRIKNLINSLMI